MHLFLFHEMNFILCDMSLVWINELFILFLIPSHFCDLHLGEHVLL